MKESLNAAVKRHKKIGCSLALNYYEHTHTHTQPHIECAYNQKKKNGRRKKLEQFKTIRAVSRTTASWTIILCSALLFSFSSLFCAFFSSFICGLFSSSALLCVLCINVVVGLIFMLIIYTFVYTLYNLCAINDTGITSDLVLIAIFCWH